MLKQYQKVSDEKLNDFKYHLNTIRTTQMTEQEYNLLCTRIKYQMDHLNSDIQSQTMTLTKKLVLKLDSGQKLPELDPKLKLPQQKIIKSKSNTTFKINRNLSSNLGKTEVRVKVLGQTTPLPNPKLLPSQKLIPPGRLQVAQILPISLRKNPFMDPPPVTDIELFKGIMNLQQTGYIPRDVNIEAAFKRGGDILRVGSLPIVLIDPCQLKFLRATNPLDMSPNIKIDSVPFSGREATTESNLPLKLNGIEVDPFLTTADVNSVYPIPSKRTAAAQNKSESLAKIMQRTRIFHLEIVAGKLQEDKDVYQRLKGEQLPIWGSIYHILKKLEIIARQYGLRVIQISNGLIGPSILQQLNCFLNQELMVSSYQMVKKQFHGTQGLIKAVIVIQSRVRQVQAYRLLKRTKTHIRKIISVQRFFRLKMNYLDTKVRVQLRNSMLHERQQERSTYFKLNWSTIKEGSRVEVHLPSYSMDKFQRLTMSHFRHREALGLTRLFALRDPSLEMIYVLPLEANSEVINYYWKVLEVAGVVNAQSRVHFVFPENSNKFVYSFSVSQLLYYSPIALKQIKSLISGKIAYIVPLMVGKEDFLIADYLNVCIFSPPFDLVQDLCRKSVSKVQYVKMNTISLPVSPGATGIRTKEEFIDKLTVLIAQHPFVSKWIFKVDTEFNGRGTAQFSLEGIKQYNEILRCSMIGESEVVLLRNLVSALLPLKTSFSFATLYPSFDDYLDQFLSKGGIIEAYPFTLTKKVDDLISLNLIFFIEPNGHIQYMNSNESIVINEFVSIGQVYPQFSMPSLNAEILIQKLGSMIYQRNIWGYCRLSILGFNDGRQVYITPPILFIKLFWCRRLSIGMDDQVTAILMATPLAYDQCQSQNNSIMDVANELNGFGSNQIVYVHLPLLYHSGLEDKVYRELFSQCRQEGIAFDMEHKRGTLMVLCDEIKAGVVGLITIKDSHRKAIKEMTDSLNFILHFAGNVVKMQNDSLRQYIINYHKN